MAVTGLVSLAVTMLAGMLLVLDVTVGRTAAVVAVAALAVFFVVLWAVVPLRVRRGPVLRLLPGGRPREGVDGLTASLADTVDCPGDRARDSQRAPSSQWRAAAGGSAISSP
jgi:hypothetical protein